MIERGKRIEEILQQYDIFECGYQPCVQSFEYHVLVDASRLSIECCSIVNPLPADELAVERHTFLAHPVRTSVGCFWKTVWVRAGVDLPDEKLLNGPWPELPVLAPNFDEYSRVHIDFRALDACDLIATLREEYPDWSFRYVPRRILAESEDHAVSLELNPEALLALSNPIHGAALMMLSSVQEIRRRVHL